MVSLTASRANKRRAAYAASKTNGRYGSNARAPLDKASAGEQAVNSAKGRKGGKQKGRENPFAKKKGKEQKDSARASQNKTAYKSASKPSMKGRSLAAMRASKNRAAYRSANPVTRTAPRPAPRKVIPQQVAPVRTAVQQSQQVAAPAQTQAVAQRSADVRDPAFTSQGTYTNANAEALRRLEAETQLAAKLNTPTRGRLESETAVPPAAPVREVRSLRPPQKYQPRAMPSVPMNVAKSNPKLIGRPRPAQNYRAAPSVSFNMQQDTVRHPPVVSQTSLVR